MSNTKTHMVSLTEPSRSKCWIFNTLLLSAMLLMALPPAQAASASRSSSFVYDPASGLLTKEIIEPGNSQLCLVTEYAYDAYGNKTSVTTRNCNGAAGEAAAPSGDAVIASRTTSSTYDAKGQFAISTTNALNHTETRSFDPKFGGLASLTGPNGLTTTWTYDSFGRKTREIRADGTSTNWSYTLVSGGASYAAQPNIRYCVYVNQPGAGASFNYYDSLNRKVLTTRTNMTFTDSIDEGNTWYDSYGRVNKTYLPYERAAFATAKYVTYTYDTLGRVLTETAPDNSVATRTYAGLTTTVTNALNQTKTTVKNSQGQTVSITDAMGKNITYKYDPFGNLTETKDALPNDPGNVTKLTYDTRGRKTGMADPDMGTWQYFYNALGELVRQVDAKSQTVTMQYDRLGRMTGRTEPDLISTWVYDTATKGIGKLASASSDNGYSRTHSYDALGRLSGTSTTFDGTAYVTGTTYDAYGRTSIQTYPTGFAVKNIYNSNGYLTKVVNAATPTTVYWTANAMDAAGHLTQQTYGNGVVTQQTYYADTGRLHEQLAGAGNAVQNMSYTYDTIGNLTTRTDTNQSLTETYTYDSLNRIETAHAMSGAVNVTNAFAYNAIGNLTSKSDVGAYTYNATVADSNVTGGIRTLPHAVSQITGTVNGVVNPAFQYDPNGNMINAGFVYNTDGNIQSGAGRNTVWNSFNMPGRIDICAGASCKTAKFWYGPEHERVKELQADKSIVIVLSPRYDTGLHFEKKYIAAAGQLTGAIEYEHYLYAGGLMFGKYVTITQTDGQTIATTRTDYYSKDNLGSIVAITDGTGAVTQRLSYDAWGKKRYPNGAADPNGLLNNPDMYHGYTGHEHMDELGIIHMNGRLYDPFTARFLSADPHIQDPLNLQSYNRYSYVWNNPLSATDPSGYLSIFGHKILPGIFNNDNARIAVAVGIGIWTGGLVANSAWATCTLSGATWGATAGLAAGGAAYGATMGAMYGGTLESTLKGAAYGGISGGIAGAFAEAGMLGQMIGGGVNGYLQTGNSTGFMRGFAAGGIPQNLGFTDAYLKNGAANLTIGIVRDGIRGGLVSGNSEGIRLGIAYGQVNNAAGHLLGFVSSNFSKPRFNDGAFYYSDSNHFGAKFGYRAITFGNVISGEETYRNALTLNTASINARWLDGHERGHITQTWLGATYIPAQALSQWSGIKFLEDAPFHPLGYKTEPQ